MPSQAELEKYYSQKYYQEGRGSYAVSYLPEEIEHFRLKADLIFRQLQRLHKNRRLKNALDVGCGEGWMLQKFFQEKVEARGIDLSDFALKKFHPHLVKFAVQGDFYQVLEQLKGEKKSYDVITLLYAIEHARDPMRLLDDARHLLSSRGTLVVLAPNDFSKLHQYALRKKFIPKPFWVVYPDHISYFNKDSMTKLLKARGFKVDAVVGNNPIDLNLFNANSNYAVDPTKGKNTHYYRVRTDNFLASIDRNKLLDIYTILGGMGVGRDLYYYCSKHI